MKVAVFGGTGFVGSYLVDALVDRNHHPVVLVREGSEHRLNQAEHCTLITGDIDNDAAIEAALHGVDAAIYNIGILREFPGSGITFDALHYEAPVRVIDATVAAGARRFLLMSANGVKDHGVAYQQTKYLTERYLKDTSLDWTIMRPSVIFGDPRGRMEFASQLARDIVESPLPAPLFFEGLLPTRAGQFRLSPVHVENVAQAFVTSLENDNAVGKVYRLGGEESLSWQEILTRIASATGKRKLMLPVPACGISLAASLLDRFESFPVTQDQITMLMEGNTCPADDLVELGITPTAFNAETLAYLRFE